MSDSIDINPIKSKPRPLSPHLQIYSWQLTSLMSIGHRASGVALAFGTMLIVFWLVALASGPEWFGIISNIISHWFGQFVLFGYSAALFYHLLNGIRHISWDIGYGFEMNTVYRTGYAVLITAVILTSITWLIVWVY
jgi:succinate dehydrogenase / fumarate reductase cytochrome b subunit